MTKPAPKPRPTTPIQTDNIRTVDRLLAEGITTPAAKPTGAPKPGARR